MCRGAVRTAATTTGTARARTGTQGPYHAECGVLSEQNVTTLLKEQLKVPVSDVVVRIVHRFERRGVCVRQTGDLPECRIVAKQLIVCPDVYTRAGSCDGADIAPDS